MSAEERRTKRRYAHELYPHPEGPRPLAEDVPYRYAIALGLGLDGTGWSEPSADDVAGVRIGSLLHARHLAFLADALHQGLTGQDAWEWATNRASDESEECVHERATHYGVDPRQIKPYPCGPVPSWHWHYTPTDEPQWFAMKAVHIPEAECSDCTEPVPPTENGDPDGKH
ncbi:hypothetical protein [Arthrobacter woluwensis]|uniref:hypothetical protein n=1 Tax=Arthrobacter woluwensis TaxID=156980 RepID=UPI003816535D